MKTYAVYRCLYGEDFIQASIRSIESVVDKIIVFWDDTAWGNCDHAIYKGQRVDFPKPPATFDRVVERIRELNNPKVHLYYDHRPTPVNQFTLLINERVLPMFGKPDMFMFPEVDHVFREDQLHQAMAEAQLLPHSSTRQVEVWKGLKHRVPERPHRSGVMFWNMQHFDQLPRTGYGGDAPRQALNAFVHNMGFAASEHVMFWKHLTAIAFSPVINDSLPNEAWLDKWISWTPESRNLEISKGNEHDIPYVVPYPESELPHWLRL